MLINLGWASIFHGAGQAAKEGFSTPVVRGFFPAQRCPLEKKAHSLRSSKVTCWTCKARDHQDGQAASPPQTPSAFENERFKDCLLGLFPVSLFVHSFRHSPFWQFFTIAFAFKGYWRTRLRIRAAAQRYSQPLLFRAVVRQASKCLRKKIIVWKQIRIKQTTRRHPGQQTRNPAEVRVKNN